MKIVWLEQPRMASGFRSLATALLRASGINPLSVVFTCLTDNCLQKLSATKVGADPERLPAFTAKLANLAPDFIVANDKAALHYLTGKYTSLALCRGGIYKYQMGERLVPVLVVDDLFKTKTMKHASWVLLQDLEKLMRWTTGKLRTEAVFNYTVCNTIADCKLAAQTARQSKAIAVDIETTGTTISCIGYTMLLHTGQVTTFVVPFINPTMPKGCHWQDEMEEVFVWQLVKQINASPAIKILQNGSYDAVYLTVCHVPLFNYVADTMHAWHSVWIESPKRLDFMASIAMDTYQYWKDEGKEDANEDAKGGRIPKTVAGLEKYWRYNALDCHNTLHVWMFILKVLALPRLEWARTNYRTEMRQQFGPAFAMTMRGTKCNVKLQTYFAAELQVQADDALCELRIAADNPEYNPNAPSQNLELLYDAFKLPEYRKKGRTTDEKVLKMIMDEDIFASWFIEKLWECKKPANNVSKYGSGITLNGRFMYKMGAANTDTGRYGSRGHDLWVGNNVQNMPYIMRPMLEADPGYVLFDIDYAQSDGYFTAFDLQEEKMIDVMLSPDDTHCVHAAFFFKKAYDELYAAHKKKEDWTSHNVTGVRSITKRIVYGANYLMRGGTLLLTMTREPVRAAAVQLGYADAYNWSDKKLIVLCDALLEKYFQMYPGLRPALDAAMTASAANGNTYTAAFGRTRLFFGNYAEDSIKRAFAAYIGQAGTAGNINLALDNIFYGYEKPDGTWMDLEKEGAMLLFQVHDSIIGQVPETRLDLIQEVKCAMDNKCTLHGRTFQVPTEADCGLGWGKRLMKYTPNITLNEIQEHDAAWWNRWQNGQCI